MAILKHHYPWWDRLLYPLYRWRGRCPHAPREHKIETRVTLGMVWTWDGNPQPVEWLSGRCQICGTEFSRCHVLSRWEPRSVRWPRNVLGIPLDPKTGAALHLAETLTVQLCAPRNPVMRSSHWTADQSAPIYQRHANKQIGDSPNV